MTRNGVPAPRRIAAARSTSSMPDIPVESSTGLPVAATASTSGGFVTSPEAILYAGTPTSSSSATASTENGDEKKTRPRSSADSFRRTVVFARELHPLGELVPRLVEMRRRRRRREHLRLGDVRLELDRVGARLGGRLDQPLGLPDAAVVVVPDLGDDEGGQSGAELSARDLHERQL